MIEVSLFLAVTGLLFVGIAVGTQNSIFQQRFTDSVQNFAEFMRSMYSETMNVQSEGDGRSEKSIYGKLVTFGETMNLAGEQVPAGNSSVFAYNVVGKIGDVGTTDVLGVLSELEANVTIKEDGKFRPLGFAESYAPRWASALQRVGSTENYVGAVLIVRHPRSGTVYTYVMRNAETIEVNKMIYEANRDGAETLNPLSGLQNKFVLAETDFCVNPNGYNEGGLRRDVRIMKGARNGSGVEIISEGGGDKCQL